MRVIANARLKELGQRPSKRGLETESSSAEEPRPKRTAIINQNEPRVDGYCWICHTEADDKICVTCQRAFHSSCLDKKSSFSELGVCPECQSKSVSGTELTSNKFFNLDKLKKMLDVLTRRSFGKKKGRNEKFLRWPEDDREKLFKIIDLEILLDNINNVLPYTKTAEFYGDVKYMYHNACIVYGANSDDAKAAENLRRDFKSELLDLEACPECYYYLYCDVSDQDSFVRLCESPHDIVWAQLTGHPYWPAKCLKVVKGIAHVRFFGEHEQSNIPINKCYYLSESHPKDKKSRLTSATNSGVKSQRFRSAKVELLKYIAIYSRKYGEFMFYPHKTAYKPQKKQNEMINPSNEETSNRNNAKMKLEGVVNKDSEIDLINAPTVMEYSEDSLTFQNSVTSDITSPHGQYSTLDEIIPSVDVTSLTAETVEGNLNSNASVVTSINMTFSTDENHLNTGDVNPVVPSLESLPSSASTSRTEIVQSSGALPAAAANDTSNDSSIQIESLNNIMDNLANFTDSTDEEDSDVSYIGEERNEENVPFNPDIILPSLLETNPELKSVVQKARYLSDGIIIHLWASITKNTNYLGTISRLCSKLRRCKTQRKNTNIEIEGLKKEINNLKLVVQERDNTINKRNADIENLNAKIHLEEEKNIEAANNAKTIIRSLKSGCSKRIEEMLRTQFMTVIEEKEGIILKKEQQVLEAENRVKNLEEENRNLKKEVESITKEKEQVEDKLLITKTLMSSEMISEYKKLHFCIVCEKSATFVCCLNASYCSTLCQTSNNDSHQKICKRRELISQDVVKQTVSEQTSVYVHNAQGVITSERSITTERSTNPGPSGSQTVTSFTHHKKAEIKRVAAAPGWSPLDDPTPGPSSRSQSSKTKRR
ncbi:MYND-type zinc finger-containing chromatin reader ZMYND8-like isoform X2 [Argiope bruennichi]|uniref:MYND-type zinc finger-containing chromatin reader ZMYND8-like isoform X2 n=1 Tax=Argiope bruennichi TaxID=94029 RepID=UPI002495A1B3|nr:MYND-type zinc finger-containing chromatin reader ZMYND8-like isoform X2 [Argiope bruennichi]